MGPTCEILFESDDDAVLGVIDEHLASRAEHIERTRKGKVWDVWISGRPYHVQVELTSQVIELSAGLNGREDRATLRELSSELVRLVGGIASEPVK